MTASLPIASEQPATAAFCISQAEMTTFRALSGDENPLHYDDAFARERGFRAPVVYGGLIIAKVSQILGNKLPGPNGIWSNLKIDFRQPLYVGESAEIEARPGHVSEATGSITIKIRVLSDDRLIATASALATFISPKADNALG